MRKVGIIGLGHVGVTVAYTLLTKGIVDELVLIDQNENKVMAEYYDFIDTIGRLDTDTKIKVQDYNELKDADVLVTAFGDIKASVEQGDRFAELPINTKNAKEVGPKIKASGFNGIIINIANPCDVVADLLRQTAGLSSKQVFGTGTFLDTARMQRAVGQAIGQSPRSVSGYVLGEHGDSQFTAWSTVIVDGQSIDNLVEEYHLDLPKLDEQAKSGAWKVANGKGYTSYAISTCAVKMIQAVFSDAHLFMPASVYVDRFGGYVGYPAVIGANGVEKVVSLPLTKDEDEKLTKSATMIKEKTENAIDEI